MNPDSHWRSQWPPPRSPTPPARSSTRRRRCSRSTCSRSTSRSARRSSARAGWGGPGAGGRRRGRQRRGARAWPTRRAQRADPPHPRPLRQPRSTRSSSTRRGTGCCGGAIEREIHGLPWREQRPGAHVVRAALFMLWGNANDGVMCPVSMTYAAVPALRDGAPELAAEWEPRLTKPDYAARRARRDGDDRAPGRLGRARQHHPRRSARRRRLRAPRSQVVLLLSALRRVPRARPGAGRALVLPRRARAAGWSSSGSRTSSARARCPPRRSSSAGSTAGSSARRAAACRRSSGWSTTRGSTACSARPRDCGAGTLEAIHHARHRSAFGALLADQPAMQNVLADLAIESEAATRPRCAWRAATTSPRRPRSAASPPR